MAANRKLLFVLLPVLLILTASTVFYLATSALGQCGGFLTGITFYWVAWCLIVPTLTTRKSPLHWLSDEKPLFVAQNWWVILLFTSTMVIPLFMYGSLRQLSATPWPLVAIVIPIGIANGLCEEIFWRGFYVKEFPNNPVWAVVIPSLLFSLWHFAPQLAVPHSSRVLFVLSTLPLGIVNGIVAYSTKSARWTAIGHSVGAIFALRNSTAAVCIYNLLQ